MVQADTHAYSEHVHMSAITHTTPNPLCSLDTTIVCVLSLKLFLKNEP